MLSQHQNWKEYKSDVRKSREYTIYCRLSCLSSLILIYLNLYLRMGMDFTQVATDKPCMIFVVDITWWNHADISQWAKIPQKIQFRVATLHCSALFAWIKYKINGFFLKLFWTEWTCQSKGPKEWKKYVKKHFEVNTLVNIH